MLIKYWLSHLYAPISIILWPFIIISTLVFVNILPNFMSEVLDPFSLVNMSVSMDELSFIPIIAVKNKSYIKANENNNLVSVLFK